jgi:methyltransferase (TIGR00027 family)
VEKRFSSRTAEDMAGYRAMETLKPKKDRVCEDAFARHFLTGAWKARCISPLHSMPFMWLTEFMNPGAANTVCIRLRFIDDYIKTCIKDGLKQFVILGAGYDCRAYRMEELQNGVTVFEVDYPATQDKKRHVLDTLLDEVPDHVVFVPYQLEEKGIGEQLFEMGYDKSKKSLFIMEGLIMYLAPESVRELFASISHHSCPGSGVVFDFLPSGIEDGTINDNGGRNMYQWAITKGEPFNFGIDQEQLPQFLSEVGFHNVNTVAAEECRDKYFTGNNRSRSISPLFFFASATVRK